MSPVSNPSVAPIAVFDSGLGGLTVLRALCARLPHEDFFYFADARHLPYGDKPEAFLRVRGVAIAEALARRGAKALVVACNTATAVAAEAIRSALPDLPVVALEPGVKPAVALSQNGKIGVLATTRTLNSERFQRLVADHANGFQVLAQACPGLAEAIEAHGPESGQVAMLLDRHVAPLQAAGVDVIVLGCTHYPWVADQIAARVGPEVRLLDTGEAVARQLERRLHAGGRLGPGSGRLHLATSGHLPVTADTVRRLWGEKLPVEYWEPNDE